MDKEEVEISVDEYNRQQFAKILGMWERTNEYGYTNRELKPRKLSWAEIFCEVGKLLAMKNFANFEGNLSELECRIDNIEKNIRTEIHPNFPKS